MADSITSIRIPDLLENLRDGEYLIPQFQREFVWSTSDVVALLTSIVDSRPIGMLTVWEQPDSSGLDLEHISIPDGSSGIDDELEYFGDKEARSKKAYAVLDGRQRSTAIAMAFGGLRPKDSRRKFAGKYYLNVAPKNPADKIVFKKSKEIEALKLNTLANAISAGLFPFECDVEKYDDLDKQWMAYTRCVSDPKFYIDGKLPESDELQKRIAIIDNAFNGIIDTSLAVYTVPKKYDLGTICEIFETLNTTGTKVSTVDLIHSWLYSDTINSASGPLLLRDWISELGDLDGANGWASASKRPELIAQIATACYLVEKKPPTPRKYGGKENKITTVKSGDLLATPSEHWENIISNKEVFASYIGEFQKCVTNNYFPMEDCPYPILSSIYVALRWGKRVDNRLWTIDDINSVFSSFFWRTSIESRYDQGVITKMAADLELLQEILNSRSTHKTYGEWKNYVNERLDQKIARPTSINMLVERLLEPKSSGASIKAMLLPIKTQPTQDMLNPSESLIFGSSNEQIQIHHLYPKAWLRDNIQKDDLAGWYKTGSGHMDCLANLTPMLRSSNLTWRAKVPGNALIDSGVTFDGHKTCLKSHFLDQKGFDLLSKGGASLPEFWKHRAMLIAEWIHSKFELSG